MSLTWEGDSPPLRVPPGARGYVLALVRAVPLAVVVFGGLAILLLLRLVERPLCGLNRPVTPYITTAVCRTAFRLMGIGFTVSGTPMRGRGAVVANHSSWLDIFALNACDRVYFVSKAEVAGWPGIGWLARATGTVFIERDRRQAREQAETLRARLQAGHKLLFFPEGTSTDGRRVLPFRTSLFAAFFGARGSDAPNGNSVQPVTVIYHAPKGQDPRFYGWWGDMEFGPHLVQTLAAMPQGRVQVVYHPPLRVADYPDRKSLAAACEAVVRAAHPAACGTR